MKYSILDSNDDQQSFFAHSNTYAQNVKLLARPSPSPDFLHCRWQSVLFIASCSLDFFSPSGILPTCREINS